MHDVLKSQVGESILDTFIKNSDEYKALAVTQGNSLTDQQTKMKKDGFKHFITYQFLMNADKAKYGSVLKALKQQMLSGTCQYPKNIDDAHKVLSNHTWDNSKKLRSDKEKQKRAVY